MTKSKIIYKHYDDGQSLKKFSHEAFDLIFKEDIAMQAQYKPRDLSLTLQSAMRNGEYIETFVRNNSSRRVPSGDTIYRRLSKSLNFQKIESLIEITVLISQWVCSRKK